MGCFMQKSQVTGKTCIANCKTFQGKGGDPYGIGNSCDAVYEENNCGPDPPPSTEAGGNPNPAPAPGGTPNPVPAPDGSPNPTPAPQSNAASYIPAGVGKKCSEVGL